MTRQLAGQRALVTGAGRSDGLGRAIALRLADEGADVAIAYRESAAPAHAVVAELRDRAVTATAISVDLTRREDCKSLIAETVVRLGGLDILVNNAGAHHIVDFLEMDAAQWRRDLAVNLDAVFYCSQGAAQHMIKARSKGSIVVVTSSAASCAAPASTAYAAAKAGAEMLSRSMAYELAEHGIRVNAVAPGPAGPTALNRALVDEHTTRDIPLGRLASPDDVAYAVAYLVSPRATFVTGSSLAVDGGYTLGRRIHAPRRPNAATVHEPTSLCDIATSHKRPRGSAGT